MENTKKNQISINRQVELYDEVISCFADFMYTAQEWVDTLKELGIDYKHSSSIALTEIYGMDENTMEISIENIPELTSKCKNTLIKRGYSTIKDLDALTFDDLKKLRGINGRMAKEIILIKDDIYNLYLLNPERLTTADKSQYIHNLLKFFFDIFPEKYQRIDVLNELNFSSEEIEYYA